VTDRVPELWHPDTGRIEDAPLWHRVGSLTTDVPATQAPDSRTRVTIPFDPNGSVFVVFRRKATNRDQFVSVEPPGSVVQQQSSPKIEIRKAMYEATDGAGGADVTAKVAELVAGGETTIPANNATFGDPTYMHVKRLRIEYVLDGKPVTASADENAAIVLIEVPNTPPAPPAYALAITPAGKLGLTAFQSGEYTFVTRNNRKSKVETGPVPSPVEVGGPWTLRFPLNWAAPASVTLDKLVSWSEHPDAGVRYFSGTAEYEKEIDIPAELLGGERALYLDLGRVECIAEVMLNGNNLGTWWKPPFSADVTKAARAGKNQLTVRVTNLWVNRLIGDEQFPDDCEWNGKPIKRWPQWMLDGTARPSSQRLTFTTWKHWTRDSKLVDSGLIGPVTLRPARVAVVEQ
jgi:hypothetical protein